MTAVEIKNVKKVYGKGDAATVALKGVNFEANLGEVVLLMGPSGAGKSTLLTIIGALQSATSGTVKIDGQDITQLKEKDRSRLRLNKLGFVLQAYNLVPYLTVQEQFQLLDRVKKSGNLSQADLKGLLEDLGISGLVNKYPGELSGGQKQRAAIARAMYANPEILLADEPTASLDSARVEEVGQLFKKLAKDRQKAIILVTHDPRLEKYADHIYDMMDGQLTQRK
ncbi:Multidrug resistance ABC superfamily ATP binding cassette transporter, ABC protein [Lactobacillus equicursoris DSM 19284 = JCM 14600 = CIP 110162]|uniref:Putative hemin import ATP-binding protein HrtA n=2 Tax=Lactobacillus equicursoris TaxID=420645 RepID=K0NW77_9LACO|nr:ABC transporter ATP-binding protein [Lactobacillus equicursoris]KRL03077.1 ABC transporter ATP-binding protein [Lactobacillus equicursoris DSM 19284 = JCM 14600 = CIP 110162]MDD6386281.1 ABC transporter ATP-binding protein [Lactobacillus equicursoris]MDD6407975.1 ABC transporter ATP-binding protein [Lactobacillus equicursoris]CCK84186.1 Multidrug resistance ABC superfamily ATP binding cassette transporter, ABC protein [Lactobacillus equicursoris 66c]CCK85061.1 Multidrug resistance ABC super